MDLSKLLRWIPGWLGFLLLIGTGILLIVMGIVKGAQIPGFFITGAFAIVIGLFSWIVGGVSRVKGRVGDVGVLVEISDLPWWAWLVDVAMTASAFILLFTVR